MRLVSVAACLLFILAVGPACAAEEPERTTLSRFLSLVQGILDTAASAPPGGEEQAADRAMRDVLAGRNADANAIARNILPELPPADRDRLAAIVRSASQLAERGASAAEQKASAAGQLSREREAIDARRDLAAMGLTYFDSRQFLEAVGRGDAIAVRLFLVGRGVDPNARDAAGANAVEIARRGRYAEVTEILERAAK